MRIPSPLPKFSLSYKGLSLFSLTAISQAQKLPAISGPLIDSIPMNQLSFSPPSKRCCLANSHWLLKSSTISSSVAHSLRPSLFYNLSPHPTNPSLTILSLLSPHTLPRSLSLAFSFQKSPNPHLHSPPLSCLHTSLQLCPLASPTLACHFSKEREPHASPLPHPRPLKGLSPSFSPPPSTHSPFSGDIGASPLAEALT